MNIYFTSLKGIRAQNEDYHDIVMNLDCKNNNIGNINFFSVYDGHGGKEVSTFLKNNLSNFFIDKRVIYPVSKEYVTYVFDHIQKILKSNSYSYHSGSTCVIAIQFKYKNESYLNVINTGDSRCILCRDNFAMPLTKDHKPNWPEEFHRIKKLGGKIEFDGFDWRIKDYSVSRSFGDINATPYMTHKPDFFRYKLDKNDKFIVLACDGLYDVLNNCEIINFILLNCYNENMTKRINKNINIAKKLAEHAIKKGSGDNVTVIIFFF